MSEARGWLLALGLIIQAVRLGAGMALEGAAHSWVLAVTGGLTGFFISGSVGYLVHFDHVARQEDPLRGIGTMLVLCANVVLLTISHAALTTGDPMSDILDADWLIRNAPAVLYGLALSLAIEIPIALIARADPGSERKLGDDLPIDWRDIKDPDAKPQPAQPDGEPVEVACSYAEHGCTYVGRGADLRAAQLAMWGHKGSCPFKAAGSAEAERQQEPAEPQATPRQEPAAAGTVEEAA